MRLIIEDTNENAGKWAARYIADRINSHQAKSDSDQSRIFARPVSAECWFSDPDAIR